MSGIEPWLTRRDLLALPFTYGLIRSYCYFDRSYDPIGNLGDRGERHDVSIIVRKNDAMAIAQESVVTVPTEGTFVVVDKEPQGDGQYWKLALVKQ